MIKKSSKIVIICCSLVLYFFAEVQAQDFHLSQYFASPLAINPALTGKFDGLVRATMNYRNQWPTINNAYITTTTSAELKVTGDRLPEHDAVGIGLLVNIDRVFSGILATNQFSLAAAYHKGLDSRGYHHLTGALQGTYSNKGLDLSRLLFEDQLLPLIGGGLSPSPTGEPFVTDNVNYLEYSAGLMYSGSTNINNMFYVGGSLYHINRPEEHFMDWSFYVQRRYTIHAGGNFPISDRAMTHLSGIYMRQGGSYETVVGGAIETNLASSLSNKPVKLYTGLWWRVNDALIPYIGLAFFDFRLGLSYDINLSKLRTTSDYKGGFELSLFYTFNPASVKKMLQKPCGCPDF